MLAMNVRHNTMQLFVRGQAPHVVDVRGEETVGELRAQLCALEGVAAEQARLSVGGVALADDVLVNSIQAEIELDVGLLGGKVHGSLARAGKVKGQTPKVEAQEKRKKKTGRAKRRIQYRRRFVTVAHSSSWRRRRSPSSGSATCVAWATRLPRPTFQ